MNINEYISVTEAEIKRAKAEVKRILDGATAERRSNLNEAETKRSDALFEAIDKANVKLDGLRALKADEDATDARMNLPGVPTGAAPARRTASVSVGREERTYHRGRDIEAGFRNQPGGAFLLDVARSHMGDVMASNRLARHMQEEYVERPWLEARSSSSVNFSGLVVPAYLVAEAAPAVSASRPLADIMNSRELPPSGMSVNLSRITTPTAAGIQSSENTLVTTQDIDDTLLTLNVQTAAGYSQLSALTGGTQDHIYCITGSESYLYEPPERTVMIRAEQPQAASLGILFVAYEYFAYTFQRYSGQSVLINGTGLATPSFV